MTARRTSFIAHLRCVLRRGRRDRSGVALLEFGLSFPFVLMLALYGLDTANLVTAHLKVSQIALNLADNASRVGANSGLSSQQMREVDANNILQGAKLQGQSIALTTNGRIILSSLEADSAGNQTIHWQRCIGLKSGSGYDSSYGTTSPSAGTDTSAANAGTPAPNGMGDPTAPVRAPNGAGLMYVEVNYLYTPMFPWLYQPTRIHYVASFIVRDPRDFSQIFNPAPVATRSTCNLYAS